MASLTSTIKASEYILKSPVLKSIFVPTAKIFSQLAGYRKLGLRLDDLIIEETPVMQTAISRLPKDELYSRNYRLLTAHQLTLSHQLLPKSKQLKYEEDVPSLTPYILELELEALEREELNNIAVKK